MDDVVDLNGTFFEGFFLFLGRRIGTLTLFNICSRVKMIRDSPISTAPSFITIIWQSTSYTMPSTSFLEPQSMSVGLLSKVSNSLTEGRHRRRVRRR